MIATFRAIVALTFWAIYVPLAGVIGIPVALLTNDAGFLYRIAAWGAAFGVTLSGVRMEATGRDRLDPGKAYIYMSNHVSNLDPPVIVKLLPHRVAFMAKAELFKIPILSRAMRLASFVPVERKNREAAINSVHEAAKVVQGGMSMLVYPEGTRSRDGRLLPFKKGPFHMALESGASVVPITMVGTHEAWPKGKFAIHPRTVTAVFHEPIDSRRFQTREELLAAVRASIASALPTEAQTPAN